MTDLPARMLGIFALVMLAGIALVSTHRCTFTSAEQVRIDGSSTLYPITQAVAEDFSRGRHVQLSVGISGTGGGIEKFCRGEIDVAAASRPIKDSERETCRTKGIDDIVQLDIAIDALTVVVSTRNTFVQCLTVDELGSAFRQGGATRWNQLRPEWPNEAIHVYHPGPDSGTFDYFTEAVIEAEDPTAQHRTDGTASEDDNIIAVGVGNDRSGIAYFGFAYYREASSTVRAVAIDDGHGCVAPSHDTAAAGEYTPLSRRLYYYTRESTLRTHDQVRAMFDYAYDHLQEITEETGYITLPPDAIAEQRAILASIEPLPSPSPQ